MDAEPVFCSTDKYAKCRRYGWLQNLWLRCSAPRSEDHQAYDHIAPMFLAWLSQYSKYKQGELSEDDYDNWRYNFPNIQPTAGFVRNPISDELDAELQKTLNKEMKKRGLL